MRKVFVLIVTLLALNSYLNACEGDCVVCHPKLVKEDGKLDKDHAILVTCKTCHTQEEMEKIDMGSGCGQDCWDCHDIKKVTASKVPQHKDLQTCIDCHVTIDKSMFGGSSVPAFSQMPTLDSLMDGNSNSNEMSVASVTAELNKTAVEKSDSNETKEAVVKKK